MTDEQKIRQFEYEILDQEYKEKEFYNYSEEIVIPFLLQMWGDTERHRTALEKKGHKELSITFFLTNMIHGISHCIRWIKAQTSPLYDDINDYQKAHELAMNFITWGIDYHAISQEFTMWSRGIKRVTLSEQTKTIFFLNPDDYNYNDVSLQQILYNSQLQHEYEQLPHEAILAQFEVWIKNIDLHNPPIYKTIDWNNAKRSTVLPLVLMHMEEVLFPELPSNTVMEGYTLGELRYFFSVLYLNFYFIRWIEGIIDDERGVNHSFGSNPIYYEKEKVIRFFTLMTDLPLVTVTNIINDLTFDDKNFQTSISIQPFITSTSNTLFILPNLFLFLQPSRMVTGALTKGNKRKVYDKLSNKIEKAVLDGLCEMLAKHTPWRFLREKTFKIGGKQITPDLVIIDGSSKCLLIADYKNIVGPITASEVEYKMRELRKGVDQLNRYRTLFKSLSKVPILEEEIQDYSIHLMLIFHKPLPVPMQSNTDISTIDSVSFRQGLQMPTRGSLNNFLALIEKAKGNFHLKPAQMVEDVYEVKDWKIIRQLSKHN